MNRIYLVLKRPLLALVLFFVFQLFSSLAVMLLQMLTGGGGFLENLSNRAFEPRLMGISSLCSNVLIAIVSLFLFRRGIYVADSFTPVSSTWRKGLVALLGCIFGAVALDLLSELLVLPNILEDQMVAMCANPWGALAIAIGAPLGEEMLFRWGIMGHMLRRDCGVFLSILISSILFGLAHMNPAQVFFATVMGVMLGVLYWRSGSLLLPLVLHALNNSIACLQVWLLGDKVKDFSMVESFGGNATSWCLVGIFLTVCIGILGWYCLSDGRAKNV